MTTSRSSQQREFLKDVLFFLANLDIFIDFLVLGEHFKLPVHRYFVRDLQLFLINRSLAQGDLEIFNKNELSELKIMNLG